LGDTDNENTKVPWYRDVQLILTIILIGLFTISLYPQSGIILDTNNLFLLAFIIVLILSHRFKEIEIPGFLKLSQTLESVKEETQELRNSLVQIQTSLVNIAQARAIAQATTTVTINALGDQAKEISEKIETEETGELRPITPIQRTDEERINEYFTNQDYIATFATLRHILEDELTKLLHNRQVPIRSVTLFALNQLAYKNELISFDIYSGIDIVRKTANQWIHPSAIEDDFNIEKLEYIVTLGINVYYQLQRIASNG